MKTLVATALALFLLAGRATAQTPAFDPSEKLRSVLPAAVAERVLARIAEARARELPAAALENRALELAAKRVSPEDIEISVARHAARLEEARAALENRGIDHPSTTEISAAELAISGLLNRGLPSDPALARVYAKLQARGRPANVPANPGQRSRPITPPGRARTQAETSSS